MPWYGFALISAFGIALVGLIEKKTLQEEHSLDYVLLFSVTKLFLFFLAFGAVMHWAVTPHQLLLLGSTGVIGAVAFFLIAKALRRQEMTAVIPLLTFDPALTALLAFFVLGEHLAWIHVGGMVLVLIGAYILAVRHHMTTPLALFVTLWRQPGGVFAIIAVFLFAVSSVIDRIVLQQVSQVTYLGYTLIFNVSIMTILWLHQARPRRRLVVNRRVAMMIGLAAVIHIIAMLSQAKAVSVAAIGLVIALKRTSILMDVIIGGRLLREQHLAQKALASLIMIAGVVLVVWR